MSVALRTITRLQDADDINVSLGVGVDEYALVYDHDTAKFVLRAMSAGVTDHGALTGLADDDHTQYLLATGARTGASSQAQTFTNGIVANDLSTINSGDLYLGLPALRVTGTARNASERYAMLEIHNPVDGSDSATTKYAGSATLQLRAGETQNMPRYIHFRDYDNAANGWIWGVNSGDVALMYDANNTIHRLWMENAENSKTVINADGTGGVWLNWHPTDTVGGGGFRVYDGKPGGTGGTYLLLESDNDTLNGNVTLQINSGLTGSYASRIYFADRSTVKWQLVKGSANTFYLYDNANNSVAIMFDASKRCGIQQASPAATLDVLLSDAVTNTTTNVAIFGHNTSGTPAAGFGGAALLELKSNTTAAQSAVAIKWLWYEAAHDTRKADLVLTAYDTAEREGLRIRGNGSAAAIGFLGAAPAARIAHVADPSGGATVDAEARSAINSILATLETFGLHATS